MASKAVVAHVVQAETEIEARIVEALNKANAMIVENRAVVAAKRAAQLEAIQYTKFVSAAESTRERLIAAGTIS